MCAFSIFFLLARWRLRILDLADPTLFSPARLADKRPPEPASCQSPLPEDEEGGPSPPLDSTLLRGVRTSAYLRLCSMGFGPTADGTSSITPIVSKYTGGRTRMSGTFYFVARSTPKVQFARVSPFSCAEMKVQRVRVRLGSYIFALHLH